LIGGHDQRTDLALCEGCKCCVKFAFAACLDNGDLLPDRARCGV